MNTVILIVTCLLVGAALAAICCSLVMYRDSQADKDMRFLEENRFFLMPVDAPDGTRYWGCGRREGEAVIVNAETPAAAIARLRTEILAHA